MTSKQLKWVGGIALTGLLIGGSALYFTSQFDSEDRPELFVSEAIQETVVHTPESIGNWLIQISQVHQSFAVSNVTEVIETVAAQKSVAEIIKHFKSQDLGFSVCTEGMADKEQWLDELAGEAADIETFRQDVKVAVAKNDLEGVVLGLQTWKDFHESNFAPGYAQSRVLHAIAVAIEEYPAVVDVLPTDLAEYASVGRDLIYYSGALKMLVLDGLINPEDLVTCEDAAAYEAVGAALTSEDLSQIDDGVDEVNVVRLQELREDKLVEKSFSTAHDEKVMVVILGGYHDLSNNIEVYNQKNDTDYGYIEVVPKVAVEVAR